MLRTATPRTEGNQAAQPPKRRSRPRSEWSGQRTAVACGGAQHGGCHRPQTAGCGRATAARQRKLRGSISCIRATRRAAARRVSYAVRASCGCASCGCAARSSSDVATAAWRPQWQRRCEGSGRATGDAEQRCSAQPRSGASRSGRPQCEARRHTTLPQTSTASSGGCGSAAAPASTPARSSAADQLHRRHVSAPSLPPLRSRCEQRCGAPRGRSNPAQLSLHR